MLILSGILGVGFIAPTPEMIRRINSESISLFGQGVSAIEKVECHGKTCDVQAVLEDGERVDFLIIIDVDDQ